MGTNFRDYLNEQLRDPVFKAEYDALEPEFAIRQAIIDAREAGRSGQMARDASAPSVAADTINKDAPHPT